VGDEVQRFSATSGRVVGILAIVLAVAVAVAILADTDPSYAGLAITVFVGALAWAALVRPRVELHASRLVLHNMVTTVTLPLAAVEAVVVRQVLVVLAGERRYTSAAVGRSRRQLHREGGSPGVGGGRGFGGALVPETTAGAGPGETASSSYGLFVEQRIRSRVSDALAQQGIRARSQEQRRLADQVERRPAVPEIAVLAGSLAAFVVLLAV
jgi:hypothetical protein